ncbi:MAG: hypothetical protein AVDCRST_MAG73-238, partial [uncultured Thermomicrobiales bacterium]
CPATRPGTALDRDSTCAPKTNNAGARCRGTGHFRAAG